MAKLQPHAPPVFPNGPNIISHQPNIIPHQPNIIPQQSTTPLQASPRWPLTTSSIGNPKENMEILPTLPPLSLLPRATPTPLMSPEWVSPPTATSPTWPSTPSPVSSTTPSPASSGKDRMQNRRCTTSLGALGQALHGEQLGLEPREDSRANAVQICPICRFQAATKNPYRNLQVCFSDYQGLWKTIGTCPGPSGEGPLHGEDQVRSPI